MDPFRKQMEERWLDFDDKASALRDGNVRTDLVAEWYRGLDPTKRSLADLVLGDWAAHGSPGRQFDALALIREFRIRSTEPALHELAAKLDRTSGPAAKDLREKVQSVIDTLKGADH